MPDYTRTPGSFVDYARSGGRVRSFGRYGAFHTLYGSRPRIPEFRTDASDAAGDVMMTGEQRLAERSGLFGGQHQDLEEVTAAPNESASVTTPPLSAPQSFAPGESDAGVGIDDASYQLTPEAQARAEARTTPTASAHYTSTANRRTGPVRFDPPPVTAIADRAPIAAAPIPFSNRDPAWIAARERAHQETLAFQARWDAPARRLADTLFKLIFPGPPHNISQR